MNEQQGNHVACSVATWMCDAVAELPLTATLRAPATGFVGRASTAVADACCA